MPFRELTKRFFLGKSRDPLDPHVFHQLSLNLANRLLHNQTPFAVQRRLQFEGLQTVILPIQVSV